MKGHAAYSSNPQEQLAKLYQQHQTLAQQVDVLERRAFLTPSETQQMAQLKKRKLAAKDRLFALKRQL